MRRYIFILIVLCMHCIARGQTGYYWFDRQAGEERQQTTAINGQLSIDVSALMSGVHTIHYQMADSENRLLPTVSALFIKPYSTTKVSSNADTYCCWFDEDYEHAVKGKLSDGGIVLDTESLANGVHTVHVYVEGEIQSPTLSSTYIKFLVSESKEVESLRCVCYIDGEQAEEQMLPSTGGVVNWSVDVSSLPLGVHTQRVAVYDQDNVVVSERSSLFVHYPQTEKYLTKYDYWLNDEDMMKTVELEGRPMTYNLLTMLPVEPRPIRPGCFQFSVVDGTPTVYAKNDIHIRFHDASGEQTDVSGQFVDSNISQEVEAEELLSGVSQTIAKPADNEIRWFKVEAVRGDSLTFKTNHASTLQLFSPSGEEIYAASSPEVLQFGGAYAPEDGDYYVALHDVTANTSTVAIEYQHIDKFAVLSYTPDSIGVAVSFVELKLDGNGYDKLEKATLSMGESSISADSINIISKSSAILRFPIFGDEEQGDYDVLLDFNDDGETELLTIDNGVTLSPVQMGNIDIRVTPSETIGYPYPVTISVTNTGNYSMLYVPFNIATTFDFSEFRANASFGDCAWSSMWPLNFELPLYNDSIGYSPYTTSNSLFGTGLPGMVLHGFIPVLGPHETRDYIVGFVGTGHARFLLYAWTGRPLNAVYEEEEGETNIYSVWKYLEKLDELSEKPQNVNMARRAPNYSGINNTLSVADHINENAARTARTATGIGLAGGGIINGLRLRQIHQYDDDDFARDVLSDYREDLEQNMPNPGDIASTAGMPDWLAALLGLQQQQAGCGNPMPDGHVIEILAPGDPNDITGYTSDAGSKYMKEGTNDFYYNIEFENDSALANAAAHTIVVTDTLDATRFDLSSFCPTNIKVGKKTLKLNGEKSFTGKTIDLRPDIEVVAQVSLAYDEQKGIARWTIESLDPYSMEPIKDAYRGVLPVNTDGNGSGELTFDIKLKPGMQDGESVSNRAGIVFDQENTIMTPTWTNIVDGVLPVSRIIDVVQQSDTTAVVQIEAIDERSQPWKYDLYLQDGVGAAWRRVAVGVPIDSTSIVKIYDGINHGFYVIATDSAGNVEQKNAIREFTLNLSDVIAGDVNGDGVVNLSDADGIVKHFVGRKLEGFIEENADADGDGSVNLSDARKVVGIFVGKDNNNARKSKTIKQK